MESPVLLGEPHRAPPMGRALRILLGLVLIGYTVPVYFRIPIRLAVGAWLLVLGLVGVYSLLHIVLSRHVVVFVPSLGAVVANGLLIVLYVVGGSGLPILATERVSSQRLPFLVFR